ncbi:MAG: hypothetical protein E7089_01520 [Bacteroidales bacterium]|nr:hypothetical protein [Bacteroidales bacterium]
MDAFLTPNEADDFWALRNYRASEQNTSLLVIISERSQSSPKAMLFPCAGALVLWPPKYIIENTILTISNYKQG